MEIAGNELEQSRMNSIELNRTEQNRCITEQGMSRIEHKWNTKKVESITMEGEKENHRMKIQLNRKEREQNRTQ